MRAAIARASARSSRRWNCTAPSRTPISATWPIFAELRAETYAEHAWPRGLGRLFERNGLVVSLATALSLGFVMILTMLLQGDATLYGTHTGPGAFYAVIPFEVMVTLGGLTFGWAVIAMAMGARSFWRASGGPLAGTAFGAAGCGANPASERWRGWLQRLRRTIRHGAAAFPSGDDVGIPAVFRGHLGRNRHGSRVWLGSAL
jgi:hypothetical protein